MSLTLYWLEWSAACVNLALLAVLYGLVTRREESQRWAARYGAQIRNERERSAKSLCPNIGPYKT